MKYTVALIRTETELVEIEADSREEALRLVQSGVGDGKDVGTTDWMVTAAQPEGDGK